MKNPKGSESALTTKTRKATAKGTTPEVTTDNGTTVVLPNLADAPAPPKAAEKKKAAPTVATKAIPGAAATGVPDWAKRAAGRNTAADMAAVPEAGPVVEPAPEAPTPKKGRASKPPKAKPATTTDGTATPGSLRAIGNAWVESIRAAGHSKSTVSSYTNDLRVAFDFLGETTTAADITEKQIAKFNVCDLVMKKKSGKGKATPTVLKTRRALRLALVWAEQKGLIKKAPFATRTPA